MVLGLPHLVLPSTSCKICVKLSLLISLSRPNCLQLTGYRLDGVPAGERWLDRCERCEWIVSRKGFWHLPLARSDLMLIKLAEAAFKKTSWPTNVQTGRLTFPLGENARNIAVEKLCWDVHHTNNKQSHLNGSIIRLTMSWLRESCLADKNRALVLLWDNLDCFASTAITRGVQ